MKPILTFAIPTYNRKDILRKQINDLLSIPRADIEFYIRDNASDDGTDQMVADVKDSRLRYERNGTNIGGSNNMIETVFNARGKYAFLLLDRDWVWHDHLEEFIDWLKSDEYSYVNIPYGNWNYGNDFLNIEVYNTTHDSLVAHDIFTHPTAMIYNTEILNKYYAAKDFYKYEHMCYAPTVLSMELMGRGKTARYNQRIWSVPSKEFYGSTRSRFKFQNNDEDFFMHPKRITEQMCVFSDIICKNLKTNLKESEIDDATFYFFNNGRARINCYKEAKLDDITVYRYNLTKEYIPTYKLLKFNRRFYKDIKKHFAERDYPASFFSKWEHEKFKNYLRCIKYGLHNDLSLIKRRMLKK